MKTKIDSTWIYDSLPLRDAKKDAPKTINTYLYIFSQKNKYPVL